MGGLVDPVCSQQAGRHLLLEPFGAPSHETLLKENTVERTMENTALPKRLFS